MKKSLIYIIGLFLVVTSCTHIRSLSSGIENEGFLEFIYSNPKQTYEGGVNVSIDEKTTFIATVNKDKIKSSKGNIYSISSGTHTISVSYKGEILYKKQVFISSQQTIKIKLP
jgi:hypothetical protein